MVPGSRCARVRERRALLSSGWSPIHERCCQDATLVVDLIETRRKTSPSRHRFLTLRIHLSIQCGPDTNIRRNVSSTMPGRTRPIDKLATAAAKCSKEVCTLPFHNNTLSCFRDMSGYLEISCFWTPANGFQSSVYGTCIFADYNNVRKDMCANEFMKLKECYLVSLFSVMQRFRTANAMHRRRISNGSVRVTSIT
jgi:hypothetical protein